MIPIIMIIFIITMIEYDCQGTYGKVKLGYHQITGRRVAIKKISKQHAPLMAREIHHHRQLKHPNIVTLFEILTTESAIYVVCEHCPNGELFDLLTSEGRFSEQRAQSHFRQLIHALRHCHERGIVHRQVPSLIRNLFLAFISPPPFFLSLFLFILLTHTVAMVQLQIGI